MSAHDILKSYFTVFQFCQFVSIHMSLATMMHYSTKGILSTDVEKKAFWCDN